MSDEIQEFLRRAAQRRAQQKLQGMQPPAPSPPQAPKPEKRQQRKSKPLPSDDDVVDAEIASRPLSKVAREVEADLDTRSFQQRADRLGDVPEQSDERMQQHLHEKFDHQLGRLGSGTKSVTDQVSPDGPMSISAAPHPLLEQLANPQSLRAAFIFSEIFQRKEF